MNSKKLAAPREPHAGMYLAIFVIVKIYFVHCCILRILLYSFLGRMSPHFRDQSHFTYMYVFDVKA